MPLIFAGGRILSTRELLVELQEVGGDFAAAIRPRDIRPRDLEGIFRGSGHAVDDRDVACNYLSDMPEQSGC